MNRSQVIETSHEIFKTRYYIFSVHLQQEVFERCGSDLRRLESDHVLVIESRRVKSGTKNIQEVG